MNVAAKPQKKKNNRAFMVRVDDDLYQLLQAQAAREERPLSQLVRVAVRKYVKG